MTGAFSNTCLVGIEAIKCFENYAEIKRMYVEEDFRGLLIAEKILTALEKYAVQKGLVRICLETGNLHYAALKFYKKMAYTKVESFGYYKPNNASVYFEKKTDLIMIKEKRENTN